jgi:hypothetical protein
MDAAGAGTGDPEFCMGCKEGYLHFKKEGEEYGFCGLCDDTCVAGRCVERDRRSCTRCPEGTSLVKKDGEHHGYCLQCPKECKSCTVPKASRDTGIFSAELGAKNGVEAAKYWFMPVEATSFAGKYSDVMVKECNKFGM